MTNARRIANTAPRGNRAEAPMNNSATLTSPAALLDTYLSIGAIEARQPDPDCVATSDEHATLAVPSYAAAGLSNTAIAQRIRLFSPDVGTPERRRHCCATIWCLRRNTPTPDRGVPRGLACEVPCWPDDPQEIAAIV